MKKLLLLLSWLCTTMLAFAQNRPITGAVTDEDGIPLRGVNVLIRDIKKGVQTDANGNFKIDAPGTEDVTLLITNTGFKPVTITADGKSAISIKLEKDITALEDVVVV